MAPPFWKKKTKNDHEAGSSSGRRRREPSPPPRAPPRVRVPPPPRARDFVIQLSPEPEVEEHVGHRDRRYVPLAECQQRWAEGDPCDHPDVNLPGGWHLNQSRVPVPPPPKGDDLTREIERRRRRLSARQRRNPAYARRAFWVVFLRWEHEARRACSYRGEWEPEDEEDGDDVEPMDEQEQAPPVVDDVKLAELMPAGLSDEEAMRMALEESKAIDDAQHEYLHRAAVRRGGGQQRQPATAAVAAMVGTCQGTRREASLRATTASVVPAGGRAELLGGLASCTSASAGAATAQDASAAASSQVGPCKLARRCAVGAA